MTDLTAPPERQLAVLITFDQLPLAGVGCYGNEWVDTPAFDALAASGFVFDCLIASRAPADDEPAAMDAAWLQNVLSAGKDVTIIREPAARTLLSIPPGCRVLACEPGVESPTTPAEMSFARLVQAARSWLDDDHSVNQSSVLWLHSAGMSEDSLPPIEAWDLYADEFSETAIDWSALSDEDLVRHPALRAAYLSLLDQWLEQLTSRFRNRPESILLQVCGVGGGRWLPSISSTPLPGRLDAASIQAPWIVWESPRSQGSTGWDPGRSRAMVQPGDLGPTTLEWLGLAGGSSNPAAAESPGYSGASVWPLIRGELTALRPWVKTTSAGDSFSVWSLHDQVIFDAAPLPDGIVESAHVQRFRQPEDPWNAFNVAGESQVRVAEVIQGLRQDSSGPSDQPS